MRMTDSMAYRMVSRTSALSLLLSILSSGSANTVFSCQPERYQRRLVSQRLGDQQHLMIDWSLLVADVSIVCGERRAWACAFVSYSRCDITSL